MRKCGVEHDSAVCLFCVCASGEVQKMREEGIEPPTAGSGIQRSTTELFPHHITFNSHSPTQSNTHYAQTTRHARHAPHRFVASLSLSLSYLSTSLSSRQQVVDVCVCVCAAWVVCCLCSLLLLLCVVGGVGLFVVCEVCEAPIAQW